ncbi:unnamed protein product, partial [Iphiclides podalirius]
MSMDATFERLQAEGATEFAAKRRAETLWANKKFSWAGLVSACVDPLPKRCFYDDSGWPSSEHRSSRRERTVPCGRIRYASQRSSVDLS